MIKCNHFGSLLLLKRTHRICIDPSQVLIIEDPRWSGDHGAWCVIGLESLPGFSETTPYCTRSGFKYLAVDTSPSYAQVDRSTFLEPTWIFDRSHKRYASRIEIAISHRIRE